MLRTLALILILHAPTLMATEASDQQADCRQPDMASLKKKYPKADYHCVTFYEDADSCCRDPDSKNCGQPDSLNNQVNDVAVQAKGAPLDALNNVKSQLNTANKSYHAASRCRARLKIAHASKAGGCKRYIDNLSPGSRPVDATDEEVTQTRSFDDEAAKIYGRYTGCLVQQGDQSKQAAKDALAIYERSTNDAHYGLNCISREQMGEPSAQCFFIDKKDPQAQTIPTQDAEITVGRTADKACTVALGNASANGASHCEMNSNTTIQKVDENGDVVTGKANEVRNDGIGLGKSIPNGQYKDMSVFKPDSQLTDKTKPFDVVMLSNHVQGCQPANGAVLCSPEAMKEIKELKVEGFPVAVYGKGPDGWTVPKTVLVTSGPAYWDAENQKMMINAYASGGNSGGPVYIPAGTKVGGYVLQNPTIVGTTSGVYTGNQAQNLTNNTNIISVPVNAMDDYSQLYAQPGFTPQLVARGRDMFR